MNTPKDSTGGCYPLPPCSEPCPVCDGDGIGFLPNIRTMSHPKTINAGESYTAGGIKRRLIARCRNIALGVSPPSKAHPQDHDFELMEIQTHKKDMTWPNGNVTKAGSEFLPGSSQWGSKAISIGFNTEKAWALFDTVSSDESERSFIEKVRNAENLPSR